MTSATAPAAEAPLTATWTDPPSVTCGEGFQAGTPWSDVPDDWPCPDCAVREKVDFEPVS